MDDDRELSAEAVSWAEEQDRLGGELIEGLMGMIDLPPVDDAGDPLESLAPEWRRLAEHVLASFDPADLPRMFRPFAPTAVRLLALKLGHDPAGSRISVLELIDVAVTDLGITRDELGCWDAIGLPLAEPVAPPSRAGRA